MKLILLCTLLLISCSDRDPDAAAQRDDARDRENAVGLIEGEALPDPEGSVTFESREKGDSSLDRFEGTIMELAGGNRRSDADPLPRLVGVRSGSHEGYDRVVFEYSGTTIPEWSTEYIDRPAHECGSGKQRFLAGDGWLQLHVEGAAAHTDQGEPTVTNRDRTLTLPNLRQLALICDFEGNVTWVLGLEIPTRYRVLELTDPVRIVLDVRHP